MNSAILIIIVASSLLTQSFVSSLCTESDKFCQTCDNNNQEICSVCLTGYQISSNDCLPICPDSNWYQGYCITTCPQDTYSQNNVCLLCSNNCSTCSSNVLCKACNTGFVMRRDQSCQAQCPPGTFVVDGNCIQCASNCTLCSDLVKCTVCDVGFYLDSDFLCQECRSQCASCLDNTTTKCQACKIGFFLYGSTCGLDCPSNYFQDPVSKTCIVCQGTCLECDGLTSTNCLSCKTGFYLSEGQCLMDCPDGTYQNNFNYTCTKCGISCSKCGGSGNTNCLECQDGFYLKQTWCVTDCPTGFFKDDTNNLCSRCPSACDTCSSISCITCRGGYYMLDTVCASTCAVGWQNPITNTCDQCQGNCLQCLFQGKCLQCQDGYFLSSWTCVVTCPAGQFGDSVNKVCSNCPTGCLECTDVDTCQRCLTPSYLMSKTLCLQQCPINKYKNNVSYTCVDQCPSDQNVLELTKQCYQSCPNQYFKSDDLRCLTIDECPTSTVKNLLTRTCTTGICPEGYFKNESQQGICTQQCTHGNFGNPVTRICTSQCSAPYYGDRSTLTCVLKCPMPYYQNQQVTNRMCVLSCGSLYAAISVQECYAACPGNLFKLDYDQKQCIVACPPGYNGFKDTMECKQQICPTNFYSDTNNICQQCDLLCITCFGGDNMSCNTCADFVFQQGTKCLDKCEDQYYFIIGEYTCIKCNDEHCQQCSSIDYCNKCQDGFLLQDYNQRNRCVQVCIDGYYNLDGICKICDTQCRTCDRQDNCTSCLSQSYLEGGKCNSSCADGQYQDSFNSLCLPCNTSCAICSGPSASKCTKCKKPYYYQRSITSCFLKCPEKYFGNNFSCVQHCPNQMWGDPISRLCLKQCPIPSYGDLKSQTCKQVCASGTYQQLSSRSCQLCDSKCEKCSGPLDQDCILCSSAQSTSNQYQGYYKNGNVCTKSCNPSQYPNQFIRQCTNYLTYKTTILEEKDDQVTFKIEFSNIIDGDTLNFNQQIFVSGLVPSQDYTLTVNQLEPLQSYTIQTQFLISHESTNIILSFGPKLRDFDGTPLLSNDQQTIPVSSQFQQVDGESALTQTNKVMTLVYICIFLSVYLLCKVISSQIKIFYQIIFQLQSIGVLILLNFKFANPVKEGLLTLNVVNLRSIPIIGSKDDEGDIIYFGYQVEDQLPQNNLFLVADYTYSYIQNGGVQLFIYIIIFWIMWLISRQLRIKYYVKNSFGRPKIQLYHTIYELFNELIIRVHEVVFYPIAIVVLLQMWGANFDNGFNVTSFVAAIIVMCYYCAYLLITYDIVNEDAEDQEHEDYVELHYGQIYNDFSKDGKFKANFLYFQYFIKAIYVTSIVLLNKVKWAQFSIICLIQLLYLVVLLRFKPYRTKFFSQVSFVGQIIFMVILIVLFAGEIRYIQIQDNLTIEDEVIESQFKISTVFVVFIQVLLNIYMLLMMWNKGQDLLRFINTNPEWSRDFLVRMEKLFFSGKNSSFEPPSFTQENKNGNIKQRSMSRQKIVMVQEATE